jgi:hypothetical protein
MDTIETTETETALDAIQIAALRKANRVCFFHRANMKPDASGFASYISAVKENRPSAKDPFGLAAEISIPCKSTLRDYSSGEQKVGYLSEAWSGFDMIHVAQSEEVWQTTASLLRPGDKLTLDWWRGGFTTEAMQNASPHFYGDSLHLQVRRGEKVLTFHISTRVGEDNTARMVRKS